MKDNQKYLIVSDLDGTLLNKKSELSSETISTIKKIIKDGHIFCIATGRPLRGSIDIYHQLGLNSLLINHNGSYISNPCDDKFNPIELCFSKDLAIKILKNSKIQEIITNAFLEVKGSNYQLKEYYDDLLWEILLKYYHMDIKDGSLINLNNNPDNLSCDVYAILLYLKSDDTSLFDKLMYHIKNISPYLQVRMIRIPSAGMMIEINTLFADKAMGVNYLASYYGIPKDRIITFGDGDNDMYMLAEVKYGFAMKNGKDTAKMSARHITKYDNDEDGVAWDLKYFMNNKDSIS